jgi:AraC-like DNA-binding protein
MLISEIHPKVLSEGGRVIIQPGRVDRQIINTIAHDIQFVYQGSGMLIINGVEFPVEQGDVITVLPGEQFTVISRSEMPFSRYYLYFDFYREAEHRLETPLLEDGNPWPRIVHMRRDTDVRTKFSEVVLQMLSSGPQSQMVADGELLSLLGTVLSAHETAEDTSEDPTLLKSQRNVQKAERFIRENFALSISITDIAQAADLSTSYFRGMFKRVTGKTPLEYLTEYRIEQGKRLMVETDFTISEIAQIVGYNSVHYFSYLFKHWEGITPSEFIVEFTSVR